MTYTLWAPAAPTPFCEVRMAWPTSDLLIQNVHVNKTCSDSYAHSILKSTRICDNLNCCSYKQQCHFLHSWFSIKPSCWVKMIKGTSSFIESLETLFCINELIRKPKVWLSLLSNFSQSMEKSCFTLCQWTSLWSKYNRMKITNHNNIKIKKR